VADHLSRWLFAPTPAAVANLAAEGISSGVVGVGDLMLDLATRVSQEIRDPGVLAAIASRLGVALAPGRFLFATVHRAENRDPAAIAGWSALLAAVAAPDRPVILALHPGTRAALAAAGLALPEGVIAVEPQGYRTSLALQTPRGGGADRFGWRSARVRVARRSVPGAPDHDRMGRDSRRRR